MVSYQDISEFKRNQLNNIRCAGYEISSLGRDYVLRGIFFDYELLKEDHINYPRSWQLSQISLDHLTVYENENNPY